MQFGALRILLAGKTHESIGQIPGLGNGDGKDLTGMAGFPAALLQRIQFIKYLFRALEQFTPEGGGLHTLGISFKERHIKRFFQFLDSTAQVRLRNQKLL